METHIAIFRQKEIRKIVHNNEWWFSVIDIVEALVGTDRPRKYWNDLKKELKKQGYNELSEKIGQLKLISSDGKKYLTDWENPKIRNYYQVIKEDEGFQTRVSRLFRVKKNKLFGQ